MDVSSTRDLSRTALFVKEVLNRLALERLVPTPENFAAAYRQLQRERDMPVAAEEAGELALLAHAVRAFDQLFIPDAWINAKLDELRELLASTQVPEIRKRADVQALLEEILGRKEELLFHIAESSKALKSSIAGVVSEIGRLSGSVSGFQTNIARYEALIERCDDVVEARRVMHLVLGDVKKLNQALHDHEQAVSRNFTQLQGAGGAILANLNQSEARKPQAAVPAAPAIVTVSPTAMPSQRLLRWVRERAYLSAVLLLVELAEDKPEPTRIKALSEVLALKVDRAMLLAHWGGAQFIVIVPGASAVRALHLAREVGREALRLARAEGAVPLAFRYGVGTYAGNDASMQPFYRALEAAFADLRPMREPIAAV